MRKRLLRRPSPAMVVAMIALFVALGPSAYATHEMIRSSDIVDGEVKSVDVGNGALASIDYATGSVQASDIGSGAVTNSKIAANAVDASKIPNDASGSDNVNATRLDGLDGSNVVQAIGGGVVRRHSNVLQPGIGEGIGLDGGFTIQYDCPTSPTNSGTALFNNNSGETIRLFKDFGGTNPAVATVAQGGSSSQATNPAGEAITFQTRRANGFMVTVWMFSVQRTSDCLWEVVALTTP
jgi:hypothetical protein